MNKNVLIVVGALVLVGGVGAYFVFGRGGDAIPGVPGTGSSKPFTGTLKAAVAMGVPMKCSYTVGGVEYEGYLKGKQYMGKFEAEGKMANVIMKDNCMWSWEENAGQGIKTCFELDEGQESIWDNEDAEAAAADLNYTYTCRPAAIADDKFTPPSSVKFLDLDEMMKGNMDAQQMEEYLKQFETEE